MLLGRFDIPLITAVIPALLVLLAILTSPARAQPLQADLFDYLERVPPDATERPKSTQINLPDSLQDYTAARTGASQSSDLSDWLRWLLLKNLPPTYEDNRKWGLQKSVYDGFRFRREGMKLETERKYKTVKHGTWSRYYLEFIDPQNQLELEVRNFRTLGEDRVRFELMVEVPLHAFGRIAQWQRDVQLISLSTNADVTVRLQIDTEVGVRVNPLVFPPEFQFAPVVKDADIELIHFEVHRISQIRGPLAEELGKGIRHMVDDRLADYEDKLVVKMNKELDKQREKLRISFGQGLPGWLTSLSPAPSP